MQHTTNTHRDSEVRSTSQSPEAAPHTGAPQTAAPEIKAPYLIQPRKMTVIESDVIIAGAGMAGQRAANWAKLTKPSLKVAMLSCASDLAHGGCSWKTHGINAAMNSNDSTECHFEDTMRGGGMISMPDLARAVCEGAPESIREMMLLGVPFDMDGDTFVTGTYGGSTVGRSIHAGDQAGNMIMNRLREQGRTLGVEAYNLRDIVTYKIDDGRIQGVLCVNLQTGEPEVHLAPKVISALGAGLCNYPIATINADKRATGLIAVLEAGGELIDMEMTQFHPTGICMPGHAGHGEIIEEEVRAAGAQLLNVNGERFMFNWDERGEIATRDIVARASYDEIMKGRGTSNNGVILNLAGQSAEYLTARFPFMCERVRAHGIDLASCGTLEVSPAAHFLMGGIPIDKDGRSSIKGLYACGEDCGGLHGGNRLGGNGVADALVFGKRAGIAAANDVDASSTSYTPEMSVPVFAGLLKEGRAELEASVKEAMWTSVGPLRNGVDLRAVEQCISGGVHQLARQKLNVLAEDYTIEMQAAREVHQKLRLSQAISRAASERTNSVGAHFRTDADGEQRIYNTFVSLNGEDMQSRRGYREGTMRDALSPSEAA